VEVEAEVIAADGTAAAAAGKNDYYYYSDFD